MVVPPIIPCDTLVERIAPISKIQSVAWSEHPIDWHWRSHGMIQPPVAGGYQGCYPVRAGIGTHTRKHNAYATELRAGGGLIVSYVMDRIIPCPRKIAQNRAHPDCSLAGAFSDRCRWRSCDPVGGMRPPGTWDRSADGSHSRGQCVGDPERTLLPALRNGATRSRVRGGRRSTAQVARPGGKCAIAGSAVAGGVRRR